KGLSLSGKQVDQYDRRCAGDSAAIGFRTAPPAAPGLVVAIIVAVPGVRDAFGLLHRQILCYADEGVGASRDRGRQVRLHDEVGCGPLPSRTRQTLRRGDAVARR